MRSALLAACLATATPAPQAPPENPSNPKYQVAIQEGQRALQERRFEDAVKAFERARKAAKPAWREAAVGLISAYRGLGEQDKLADLCRDALKTAGADPEYAAMLHGVRGTALAMLATTAKDKKLRDAEAEFRASLEARPDLAISRLNLAVTLLRQLRDEEGIAEMRAFLAQAPESAEAPDAKAIIDVPARARTPPAPPFEARARDGATVTLASLRGKVVLIDFWGSWCPPCVSSVPGLVRLRKALPAEDVAFVGIASDDPKAWAKFLDRHPGMEWPQILDDSDSVLRSYKITAFPTYLVLDGDGLVRVRRSGYRPGLDDELEKEIRGVLAEQAKRKDGGRP